MAMLTATISGQLITPGLTKAAVVAWIDATTDGGRLTYGGNVIVGAYPVPVLADGTATVTLPQLPQVGMLPSDAMWRLHWKVNGVTTTFNFTLTSDTTWSAIVPVSDIAITSSLLAQAQAAAAAAQAAAASVTTLSAVAWSGETSVKNPTYGATGNGTTDDTAAIHAARDAAGAGGALVFPGPGTYLVSGLTANAANQRWRLGPGATIKMKNAGNAPVITITADGFRLEGGVVDGNRANQTTTAYGITGTSRAGVRIVGVTVQNCRDEGTYLDSPTDLVIDGCTYTNNGQGGNKKQILVNDTTGSAARLRFTDNTLDGSSSANGGMQVACVVSGHSITDVIAAGNIIRIGDGTGGANTLGIELYSNTGGIIRGGSVVNNDVVCTGVGTAAFGYSVGGVATSSTTGNFAITVTGNTAYNCHQPGVELIGRDLVAVGNTFESCGRISVPSTDVAGDMTGVMVVSNVIRNAQDTNYAIQLQGNATNAQRGTVCIGNLVDSPLGIGMVISGKFYDGVVTGNIIRKPGNAGISIGSGVEVAGTRIANNRIDMTGAPASMDGILVASAVAVDLAIEGNVINAYTRHGIFLNAAVTRVTVKDNHCYGGVTAATSNGITTAGGDHITIVGNHCHDNPNRGISLSGSPTNTLMHGNNCYSNTSADYATSGTFVAVDISGTTGTTAPGAGGAGALPATPAGYLTIRVNGTNRQIPYY